VRGKDYPTGSAARRTPTPSAYASTGPNLLAAVGATGGPVTAVGHGTGTQSVVGRVERLAALHGAGELTDDEYAQAKAATLRADR
jgi:hypothetical protein